MIDAGVVGYGTIGKRVADALRRQPDVSLVGVAKRTPDHAARSASAAGIPLYAAAASGAAAFRDVGLEAAGTLDDLLDATDVVVDATPAGVGRENAARYEASGTPAVFQGGEAADVAARSFLSRANYAAAAGAGSVRVLSCNATGLGRLLGTLDDAYGVESARCTLVRRGGDPDQSGRGPINDVLPDPFGESHHGRDVRAVLPALDVRTRAVTVPVTLMHLHDVRVRLLDPPAAVDAVADRVAAEKRLCLVDGTLGIDGVAGLAEFARDRGRPRGDLWENAVFERSLSLEDGELSLFQAIHQESNVVPENVDAVRALAGTADAETSRRRTAETLGVGRLLAADGPRRRAAAEAGE